MLAYRFPEDRIDFLLGLMAPVLAQADRYFIGCDVSPCVFEMYWRLRGLEDAMMDLAGRPRARPDDVRAAARSSRWRSPGGPATECRSTGCGAATTSPGSSSMVMSPAAWRDMIKPLMAELFAVGKARGLWVAYHCCGALRPIIPDLVEIGLDVLNPVQAGCPGMDPLELKREFGDRLAFMGGVDTQGLLPFAGPAEVRRAVERLIEGMTAGAAGPAVHPRRLAHDPARDAGREHLRAVRGRGHQPGGDLRPCRGPAGCRLGLRMRAAAVTPAGGGRPTEATP